MSTGPLYVLLGDVSVQILCPFFNGIVCLPGVESCVFFICFGDQTLKPLHEVSLRNKFSHMVGSFHFADFLKRFYLFIFRERGREGEKEGEKHQCVVASNVAPTEDLAHNPGMFPDWELNWPPFGLQVCAQSTSYTSQCC